ncbi:MAG: hypothetical protein ASARMPREDX12_003615 [Alectoria sarmentosa]|nr:MAG: hypothetical protein ASARMPRED_008076 [Alectoria sarmentosa]CAD6570417.1 MAG: hypothetical protein ASARMPREDX12_003615 [Alectoria sarmentosa]
MPPFIPSKRRLSTSSPNGPTPKSAKKPSLFDTADKPDASTTLQDNKAFLDRLGGPESESSLSDVSSADFEDALSPPNSKKRKISHHEEDEDEVDWEDAIKPTATPSTTVSAGPSGVLELTLDKSARMGSITNPHDKKKGPSKIERQIRVSTHIMHVQFLLFHNLIRNGWACDKEVQRILVGQIPPRVNKDITRWKITAGMISGATVEYDRETSRKTKEAKRVDGSERNQRDWGRPAERQERGAPNMSRGDPTLKLLKVLAAYWKKRFTITAPGLRKQGYKSLAVLETEILSFRNDKHNPEEHGERIGSILDFRRLAKSCEGSRDVGAQLFTTLIRGLGIEARLVTSLQPIGFGWGQNEEASEERRINMKKKKLGDSDEASSPSEGSDSDIAPTVTKTSKEPRKSVGGNGRLRVARIVSTDLSVDSVEEDGEGIPPDDGDDGDASVIDVTPSTSRARPHMKYDRDMPFPTYWTEVISPVTNEIHPVDPTILTPAVATSSEHLAQFESRGANADKAKQVFGYVVAYSSDGTAKDVTTRYLKRHMWPGRTKGVRIQAEKVPVYNRRGKVEHYENYDWFKTVMSGYSRTAGMRTVVDDIEEAKDLKAVRPEKKEPKANHETLQGFKNSADYVLERHLRREEALRPGSTPVKTFTTGKGEKLKEEPVYRRKDVEICRTGESWHKEGRAVKPGEFPMKMVPVRAVTLTRKREVEEAERDGEKLKQGLYALHQTDWIIPRPIQNGVIPKNAFGNIDCYVPTMVPKGAVHIPLKCTVRICRRLGIDFAEAVTGFEFGKQRAVPIITGVVVADENEHAVIDEWEKDEEERRTKEEGKREKTALATWRKWLMGLRIIQRVREEYGGDAPDAHIVEEMNPFTNSSKAKKSLQADTGADSTPNRDPFFHADNEEDIGGSFLADVNDLDGGGFLPEGYDGVDIEDERGPVDSGPLNDSPPIGSILVNRRPPDTDDGKGGVSGKDVDIRPEAPKNASTNGKKSKAGIKGPEGNIPSSPPERRAAPRRKAARKSETALKSHFFEHERDKDDDSNRGSLTSKEVAVKKPAKRSNQDKASTLRPRRST